MSITTTKPKLSLDNLPSEVIFEITKHLRPVDYVSLYKTNKALKDVQSYKPEYRKTITRYLQYKFTNLAKGYLFWKSENSVFDFDYFAKNNNVCYDGKTESFKKLYERYARCHISKDFKFNLNTYITCLSARELFICSEIKVRYDRDFALKFADYVAYSDVNIPDDVKDKLRNTVLMEFLDAMFSHYQFKVMNYIDKFTYLHHGIYRKRRRFAKKDIKNGDLAVCYYKSLKTIMNISKYLLGIPWVRGIWIENYIMTFMKSLK